MPDPPPGHDVVFEIDVYGAEQIAGPLPRAAPDLRRRPEPAAPGRPSPTVAATPTRTVDGPAGQGRATRSPPPSRSAQSLVVNDDLERAVDEVEALIRSRSRRRGPTASIGSRLHAARGAGRRPSEITMAHGYDTMMNPPIEDLLERDRLEVPPGHPRPPCGPARSTHYFGQLGEGLGAIGAAAGHLDGPQAAVDRLRGDRRRQDRGDRDRSRGRSRGCRRRRSPRLQPPPSSATTTAPEPTR